MAKKSIIFWGATGQSIVLHDFILEAGYEVVAFFDRKKNLPSPVAGIPIYHSGDFESWRKKQKKKISFAIAIGGAAGKDKIALHKKLTASGLIPSTLIHPAAFVSPQSALGAGTQVLAGAAVIARARLGMECIVNTHASVDHECELGHGVHIAPGATLTGCVKVGDYSFIGSGAVVLPRVKIGSNAIIGAGSVVTKDIPSGVTAYGSPAKIIRDNQ